MPAAELILASASPRRKVLLEQIDLSFRVVPSQLDEPPYRGHEPAQYASDLASLKAAEISELYPTALVIGADTIVVIGEKVLGKPEDAAGARKMLDQLSGRNHQVITAYSFKLQTAEINQVHHVVTQVHFKQLSPAEIDYYINTGAPFDKAGAYGIQDYSSVFVDHIEGCFYNVVGLPLSDFKNRLSQLLIQHDISLE